MKQHKRQTNRTPVAVVTDLLALLALVLAPQAMAQAQAQVPTQTPAQERPTVEMLQATTQALIEALVDSGLITRDKANQLIATAAAKAKAAMPLLAPAPTAPESSAEIGKDGKKVIRVPYVPQAVKDEMRNVIKQEVLQQARTERWGQPGAYPAWVDRFKIEGDYRLRGELTSLSSANTAAGLAGYTNGSLTRAADISQNTLNSAPSFNTQEDFDRLRVRARLGVTATLSDQVSTTLRVSTGNTSDRTSTNQTLGQSFNKYQLVADQAYLTVRGFDQRLILTGGRLPNPFFSTDLLWADDLGFEGVAATGTMPVMGGAAGFVTAGYFPLTENRPGTTKPRALLGVQTGLDMKLGQGDRRLKIGVAIYNYQGIEGVKESPADMGRSDYATRSEYGSGFRQRGNTLFNVRASGDTASPVYGLASSFQELNLTAALDWADLLPQHLRITGDVVKNLGFNRDEMARRTGQSIPDGGDIGFLARVQLGQTQINKRGDWNASLAYRYLGSDAVLDAFTNSDFGLGGTNNKGLIAAVNYGLFVNTSLSARWMSANPIDSYAPGSATSTKLAVDAVQVEISSRF
jgi:hypothetical protein